MPKRKIDEEEDLDYNDLCSECFKHDECHKSGIDYDQIDKCNAELRHQREIEAFDGKETPDIEPFVLS